MFAETINGTQASRNGMTGARNLLALLSVLAFTLCLSPTKAHAQIIGGLEVDIPFQFHVGDARLPAGKYYIHPLDNTDLTVMEISRADGSASALFDVRDAETNSAPSKSELIFNKYGKSYFLSKVFDAYNPNGSAVGESRYEKKVSQATAEAQTHVAALHRAGN